MIAHLFTTLLTATALLLMGVAPLCAQENLTLENEFVRVVVNKGPDEAGRFSIKTTGGDPALPQSKNQHLIFGANAPWTSYTTVLIDGEKYVFGGPTRRRAGLGAEYGEVTTAPTRSGGKILTTTTYGDVEVVQELGIVRGMSSRMLDTVSITYRVTNKDASPRAVGLRVLLDTMCGANDGAPIRAGDQAITMAGTISGKDIPDFWQAFDSLANPTVISQGTLRGGGATAPHKVIFADWGSFADDPWEPTLSADQGFIRRGEEDPDTAAALLWNAEALEPGRTRTYVTYYGIGYVKITPGKLMLGMAAPAETTFAHERTQPFTITGYLQNTGGFDGRDVTLTLTLPAGLTLVGGGKLKQTVPLVKTDETVQGSWTLRANGKLGGTQRILLEVSSANIESNSLAVELLVHVPQPRIVFSPDAVTIPMELNGIPATTSIFVNLAPAENFHGARFVVTYDPAVVMPVPVGNSRSVSCGTAFIDRDRMLSWRFSAAEPGKITITGLRTGVAPFTQAETNLAIIEFYAVGVGSSPLTFTEAVLIDAKGAERPVKVSPGKITVIDEPAP